MYMKIGRCEHDEIRFEAVSLQSRRWKDARYQDEIFRCEGTQVWDEKMWRSGEEVGRCEDVKMSRWKDVKMTRWHVWMWTCMGVKTRRRGRYQNHKMVCADDDICDEDPCAKSLQKQIVWTTSRRVCVSMLTCFCCIDLHTYPLTPWLLPNMWRCVDVAKNWCAARRS